MTSRLPLGVVVFLVGTASLGAEIAAARLLAPWFGASTIVWANTIAVVLVALSIGYAIGGRLADRNPSRHRLSVIILLSGVLLAVVPFVSGPFLKSSQRAFANLSVGTFAGSLLGVGVLVAIPLVLLGTVSPYAVRLSVESVEGAGKTAGRLYAISTVGSLVGTFAASLVLIPFAGTRNTFLAFAVVLALTGALGLERLRVPAVVVPVVIAAMIALPEGVLKASSTAGEKVIWEKETEYQYARVLQATDGTRTLELNEGQAIHSLYRPGSYLTNGYWDDQLSLLWAGGRTPRSVAILGNAAGTTARALGHFSPDTRIDAVEIDPDVTEVGKELFGMTAPRLHTYTADARPWLENHTGKQDAIVIDAYRQPYIPFYLTTREFFELVKQRLNPGGVVVVNVGHPEGSLKLTKVMVATMRSVFGDQAVFGESGEPTNTMLVGTNDPSGADPTAEPATALSEQAGSMPPELATQMRQVAGRFEPQPSGGPVYTDDKAPVEWLIDLSLADVATGQ